MEWYEIVPNWITSIGTVGAVVVALFSKGIRDWYNRPKISITCPENKQCQEQINNDSESSDSSPELRIRIKLENTGNYIANHASINVDCIYKRRGNENVFVQEDFTPIQMKDYRNSKPTSIAPHLVYYFDIASIHKYDDMTNEDGNVKSKQFYKLYLLGDGNGQELGKGTFIIPLKFYSSRIKVSVHYLKIYWDSDDFTTDKMHFSAEIITKEEFAKLKKK